MMTTAPAGDMTVPAANTHRDAPQRGFTRRVQAPIGVLPRAECLGAKLAPVGAGTSTSQGVALGAGQASRASLHDGEAVADEDSETTTNKVNSQRPAPP